LTNTDVSEFLARKGFSNIFNFEGGIKKWSGNLLKTCAPNVDLPLSTSLEDVDGEQFLLNDLINNGPTIIYFFDVNNDDTDIKLLSLQNINKIQNSNLSIIALYSDNFTKGLVIKRELGLEYYVVNDKSGELIQELSNNSKTDNSVFETFFMFDGSERIYRFDIEELDQVINYIK
jgi:peroxiredoxin